MPYHAKITDNVRFFRGGSYENVEICAFRASERILKGIDSYSAISVKCRRTDSYAVQVSRIRKDRIVSDSGEPPVTAVLISLNAVS